MKCYFVLSKGLAVAVWVPKLPKENRDLLCSSRRGICSTAKLQTPLMGIKKFEKLCVLRVNPENQLFLFILFFFSFKHEWHWHKSKDLICSYRNHSTLSSCSHVNTEMMPGVIDFWFSRQLHRTTSAISEVGFQWGTVMLTVGMVLCLSWD